jgi:hypothetical protein
MSLVKWVNKHAACIAISGTLTVFGLGGIAMRDIARQSQKYDSIAYVAPTRVTASLDEQLEYEFSESMQEFRKESVLDGYARDFFDYNKQRGKRIFGAHDVIAAKQKGLLSWQAIAVAEAKGPDGNYVLKSGELSAILNTDNAMVNTFLEFWRNPNSKKYAEEMSKITNDDGQRMLDNACIYRAHMLGLTADMFAFGLEWRI